MVTAGSFVLGLLVGCTVGEMGRRHLLRVKAERDRERARRLRAEAALDAILDGARDPISVAQAARGAA